MLKAILFDLDGTLLPMDQDIFIGAYFRGLTKKLASRGYEPEALTEAIWKCTGAMIRNNGSCTNEKTFWRAFSGLLGDHVLEDMPVFEEFYHNEFQQVKEVCGCNPQAKELMAWLKTKPYQRILATNPLFPAIATHSRVRWAGLQPEDFSYCTTYENSSFSKPNPDYYREILQKNGLEPSECLMIGNDVAEDMITRELGLKVFLLTDCLINKNGADISQYPHGSFPELRAFLETI